MSDVWKHFVKINKTEAQCTFESCKAIIKLVNYGTSSLKNHLIKHESEIKNKRSVSPGTSSKKKIQKTNTLNNFVVRESRAMLLAKCAAKDGFPISKILTSDACKAYLASRNFQMPLSRTTIWEEIGKYHQEVLQNFKEFVQDSKDSGKKFSIIIDEWTDNTFKRYLNIKLHNGTKSMQYSLAAIGAGKCDASKVISIVTKKLEAMNLNTATDIVASIQDGASVMKRYGRLMPFENQFCLNHGINLAILDVLS